MTLLIKYGNIIYANYIQHTKDTQYNSTFFTNKGEIFMAGLFTNVLDQSNVINQQEKATLKVISITSVIDTDKILAKYGRQSTPNHMKPISITDLQSSAEHYFFMVASNTTINSGQGTAYLNFNANVGDLVRFSSVSGSNNMDDAVLLYDITQYSGTQVFNTFHIEDFNKVVPVLKSVSSSSIAVDTHPDQYFHSFASSVQRAGTEIFWVHFAIYTRNNNGKMDLCGYYRWEPTIVVKG